MLRRTRKNIQYLTSKIIDTLSNTSNALTLRERAIGQIAVHYGMRSGDIAALELNSIDLDREIIRIIQRKTQQPLELPLLAVADNAIYDYVTQEHPVSDCPALFLTQNAPYGKISGEGAWRASESIMHIDKIRQEKGRPQRTPYLPAPSGNCADGKRHPATSHQRNYWAYRFQID